MIHAPLYRAIVIFLCLPTIFCVRAAQEITPYKYADPRNKPAYDIPASCRFTLARSEHDAPPIVYYLSRPPREHYPIAVLCTGSTNRNSIESVIHFHRYLLQEFLDVGAAVVTIEQWGVDGQEVDEDVFMEHYTRSQRLADHCAVIDHIQAHPSLGWNGTFIFLGASEGGPLVTSLTERYQERALATINWCGAGDWGWRDELWAFLEGLRANGPWLLKILDRVPHWMPFSLCWPRARADYDMCMDKALADPTHLKEFMGMTYAYHADALRYPLHDYTKIGTPYLVVAGGQDTIIQSADVFVDKARAAGAPITYMRIEDMDHYVRHRPEIVAESFTWLLQIMQGVR